MKADTPSPADHKARNRRRSLYAIAYKCYVFLGSIALWTSLWAFLDPDPGVIGFLVMIPFGIPLLLALIFCPAASLLLWQDFRVLVLLVLTFGTVAAVLPLDIKVWPAFLLPYGVTAIAFSTLWLKKCRNEPNEAPTTHN